jgi:predicted dehydrogenase
MTGLRILLVGLGARSRVWRQVIAADPRVRLVGVADIDPARAAAVGTELGVHSATDLASLTQAVEADAVILVTPPFGRAGQIAAACAAGLAILAEKPLADSLAAAERYVAEAAAARVPLMVGLNFRYLGVTIALKALFADDRLGPPAFGRFLYERWRDGRLPYINRYPLTMRHPMLWEQSVHHFDLMRFVYGSEPVRISARTWNPPWSMYAHDANVAALISFANGVEVTYQGTWAGNRNQLSFDWRSDCARGIVVQADMFGDLSFALRDDPAPTPVALPPHEPWISDATALFAAFLSHVIDGAPLECSGADHLQTLRMVEAVSRASAKSQTITLALPPAAEPGRPILPPDTVQTERRITG